MSQTGDKVPFVSIILENFLSLYSPQENIVERTWCVDASFPRHSPTIKTLLPLVNSASQKCDFIIGEQVDLNFCERN
jgi:hypothetical protein